MNQVIQMGTMLGFIRSCKVLGIILSVDARYDF